MRTGPTTLSLPSFTGATRRLILINLGVFFAVAVFSWFARGPVEFLVSHLVLTPVLLFHGEIWQLVSYSFLNLGLLQALFGCLSLWFIGSWLEGAFGARWLYELYFTSAIGAGLLASALAYTHLFNLSEVNGVLGLNAAVFGLLIAIARYFGDQEITFFFVLRLKAKYLVAIYILFYMASVLKSGNRFDALVQLCAALTAWLYLRLVPGRGLTFAVTERLYGLRNDFYRNKRRRAAKKFEVYMGKQGREVHFDNQGRYIDPDSAKDPNDKRWMN